jgi:acetyl-CoA synthetase
MDIIQDRHIESWWTTYVGPRICMADLLCDRHVQSGRVAVKYEDAAGLKMNVTFEELRERSARFAGALSALGVNAGDRVATLLPKSPALVTATMGIWRLGAVHLPLFTAFGPQAITYRLTDSDTKVVVTDQANRPKLDDVAGATRIVVGGSTAGDVDFDTALKQAIPDQPAAVRSGDDPFILIYTSGTTGNPKGVQVPVRALGSIEMYMRIGLNVRDDDVHWNVADPGWAYGLYLGLVGTLLIGHTVLYVGSPFAPATAYRVLSEYAVTNLTAAPTFYRALRASGIEVPQSVKLRLASSAGEPLNPDLITWGRENLGVAIHDHYGQTELCMVVMNAHATSAQRELKPGSMGQQAPGFRVVILGQNGDELPPGQEGQIAVDIDGSPLYWFGGYYKAPDRTADRFAHGSRYYMTGDTASVDRDGYFYFSSRSDDLITSAGHRIGPFEVESALLSHSAVAEVAVVGVRDELCGEVVKAFIVLTANVSPSEELADELRELVKKNLSAHLYPRQIEFIDVLPKTPSGKIQRFLLRS